MVLDPQVTFADIIQVAVILAAALIGIGMSRRDREAANNRLASLEKIANNSSEVLVRLAGFDEWKRQTEFRLGKVEDRMSRGSATDSTSRR